MPLTSKFAERVTEAFSDAPVIVGGKIQERNVRYHLGRAFTLLRFLADELTSQIECEEDCDELDDETVSAVYEAWWEIVAAADGLVDQVWRFDRSARELVNNVAEIRHGASGASERLADIKNLISLIDRGGYASDTTSAPRSSTEKSADDPDKEATTEVVVELAPPRRTDAKARRNRR